jgi:hypothetical protein
MHAHPAQAEPDHMATNKTASGGREPRRYEIRVRGPIGSMMMQAFPTLAAARRGQDTLLTGSLPDQCALYGVIHELEALGLELLEIRCLPTGDPERPARSDRSRRTADGMASQLPRLTRRSRT